MKNILFTTHLDDKFIDGALVMIYSMKKHVKDFMEYPIRILHSTAISGLSEQNQDKIRKIVNENSDLAVKAYYSLAMKYNIDPVHMSLAFCNERPFMGSVIFGATDITQLRKILSGINLKLGTEINDEIQMLYKKFPLTF